MDKKKIIEELSNNFNLSTSDADFVFTELTSKSSPILHEKFENLLGPATGKYWYSDYIIEDRLERLKKEIESITLKYH
ncbi:MAG: hypothetical protein GZ087_11555 [Flavobacterium sp.]|nr:hypothetical protein [Flavobacterium sp.]